MVARIRGEILYGADDLRARRFCAAVVDQEQSKSLFGSLDMS